MSRLKLCQCKIATGHWQLQKKYRECSHAKESCAHKEFQYPVGPLLYSENLARLWSLSHSIILKCWNKVYVQSELNGLLHAVFLLSYESGGWAMKISLCCPTLQKTSLFEFWLFRGKNCQLKIWNAQRLYTTYNHCSCARLAHVSLAGEHGAQWATDFSVFSTLQGKTRAKLFKAHLLLQ